MHNNDCLLKKIKAYINIRFNFRKYLKYLFNEIQNFSKFLPINLKKFDQDEVRMIDPSHNINQFINLTISQLLINNKIVTEHELKLLVELNDSFILKLLNKKVKKHYLFDFLSSDEFKQWLKDPMKLYEKVIILVKIRLKLERTQVF